MPRQGSKRKKTRTEKESGEITEKELKQVPRCFVLKRGHVGDRIKDLVKDFREVMMPNCAKSLKEKKSNRIEDFVAVSSHYGVSHLVLFTATKAATYMKLARLPQGPTLTFKVDSFTLSREVRAAQKRPQGSSRDYITAPLQVLNGFGGPKDAPEGAGGGKSMKVAERQLAAEMLRGFFPAIDVPTFSQAECRRAALFHYDRESDAILFRHFVVGRKQMGIERGVSRLTKFNRLPNLAKRGDIADYVLGGGGAASESEIEEAAEVPSVSGGRVSVRLSESGPRMKLLLMKAEEGVCTGGVFYHRFQTKTPSQQEVLQERARQRQKLRERNARLDSKEHAVKKKAKERRKEQHRLNDRSDDEEEAAVQPNPGESDSEDGKGGQQAGKKKRFNPFNFRKKGPSSKAAGASDQSGQSKGAGKGKGKGKGKKIGTQQKVLEKFRQSAKRQRT